MVLIVAVALVSTLLTPTPHPEYPKVFREYDMRFCAGTLYGSIGRKVNFEMLSEETRKGLYMDARKFCEDHSGYTD